MEGIGSQMNQNSLVQFEPFDLNNQNQTLDGYNLLSTMQGTPVNDLHTSTWVEIPNSFPGAQQNAPSFAVSEPSPYPLAVLSSYLSNQFTNGLSSSFASSVNYGPVVAGFQPGVTIANPFGSSSLSNELSLSLATSQPSAVNVTNISDQCSEISSGSKELSLSCSSYHNGRVSSVLSGSRYLQVVQEILTEIARYSLEVLEQMSRSNGGIKMGGSVSLSSMFSCPNEDDVFKVDGDPALQRRALQAKKAQLLTLLQLVDDRYGQCLDEIHTVISAFHAATDLDPQLHTCFALQTLSFLYKSFREKISNQILVLTDQGAEGIEKESDHFQKQWTLQQLKRKDHHMWKPQRGLPERSVSVLRAWMFQNFLHPYPKDAEKHLLAVKSGLTRSQVSNWFINARVRLWKPMIEEMYAEMNKRKGEGSSSNHRNEFSFGNLRFNISGI